jgi:hypothetical protein
VEEKIFSEDKWHQKVLLHGEHCAPNIVREQNPAKPAHDGQNPSSVILMYAYCVVGEYCPANINPAKAAHGEQQASYVTASNA